MKRLFLVFLCLVTYLHLSHAEPMVWDLRGKEGVTEPDRIFQFEQVPTDLRVRVNGASILVPAGWSFGVAEDSSISLAERNLDFVSYVTLSPTTDLEHELTYIAVVVKKHPSGLTLEERANRWMKKPNWEVQFVLLGEEPWALAHYPWENPQGLPSLAWAAVYEGENLQFEILTIAQTPQTLATPYAAIIENLVMQIRAEP